MKAIVLGGLGFIGVNLTKGLLERGYDVTVMDLFLPPDGCRLDGCRYVQVDFNDLSRAADEFRNAETVFHLISTTIPATSNLDPGKDVRENLVSTLRLLDLCVEYHVRRVIFPSSGGTVYGIPERLPIPETHPTNPICSYGIVKLSVEKYLHMYRCLYGLEYRVLRISNPYGPYQNFRGKQGALGIFIYKTMMGENIDIWGDGTVVRDYIYIADVVDAFLAASTTEKADERLFNIGSGHGYSLNEILKSIGEALGKKPVVSYTPGRTVDVPVSTLDISRAEQLLGWKPATSMKDGILKTAAFLADII
jgi:UDP-glucose 4-epimerase